MLNQACVSYMNAEITTAASVSLLLKSPIKTASGGQVRSVAHQFLNRSELFAKFFLRVFAGATHGQKSLFFREKSIS